MNDNEMNVGRAEPWSAADSWAPGWYADPWQPGRQRRWTGTAWTTETRGALGPDISGLGGAPPAGPPAQLNEAPPADPTVAPPASRWTGRRLVAVVATLAAIALLLGFTITYATDSSHAASTVLPPASDTVPSFPTIPLQPPTGGTSPSFPSFGSTPNGLTPPGDSGGSAGGTSGGSGGGQASTDPSANVLRSLVVRQSDVTQPNSVGVSDGGDSVAGAPTLDLCNGTYPSETLRTARLQVDMIDDNGDAALSTEAVLYRDAKATAQAFSELRSVVAQCPSRPVPSAVGDPTVTTKFNARPDSTWAQVPGVERQAYDFTITGSTGATNHGVAVYLRRGRALVGLYFQDPDRAQASVAGNTTLSSIVGLFAHRLASVPASTIGA